MKEFKTKPGTIIVRDLVRGTGEASSNSEAQRKIEQKAIKIDGETKSDWKEKIKVREGMVIQIGKKVFVKVVLEK